MTPVMENHETCECYGLKVVIGFLDAKGLPLGFKTGVTANLFRRNLFASGFVPDFQKNDQRIYSGWATVDDSLTQVQPVCQSTCSILVIGASLVAPGVA